MTRNTPVAVGQPVHWNYPHDDLPKGRYLVAQVYPPTGGSGSYVQVCKEPGGKQYPALPEELTLLSE